MLMDILNKSNDRQKKRNSKITCETCRIPFMQCKHHLRNSRTIGKNLNDVEEIPAITFVTKVPSNSLYDRPLSFNCKFCDISFHEKSKFIDHNTEAGHEICSECKQHLRNQTQLKDHIDEFHSWFKCNTCSKSFSSKFKWEGKF